MPKCYKNHNAKTEREFFKPRRPLTSYGNVTMQVNQTHSTTSALKTINIEY
jgi:hypothetical protein